jgi:hypothetical protein
MPELLHLNGIDNKIKRKINKAALRQATVLLPDVPPPGISEDVTVNYTALMKSLSNILINLQEVYMSRFQLQFEGEADYDYDEPDGSQSSRASSESGFSPAQSIRSRSSQASDSGSDFSYASINSHVSGHNPNMPRPVHLRFRDDDSSSGSSTSGSSSSGSSSSGSSSSGSSSSGSSSASSSMPSFMLPGQAPSREEERLAREDRQQNNPFSSLVLNSLTREIINAKFLAEAIIFSQLTKIQKQNVKQIMVRIGKVMGVIRTGISKPIYVNLQSVLKLIQSGLKSGGEGDAQEYLLRTQEEMPPEQAGEIEALQGAGIGMGMRKHRLLSPALYNAHNVNQNFVYSLAKRNN